MDYEKQTIKMTIPFLVRLLELVREDVKTDVNLHIILEKLLSLAAENGTLSIKHYACIEESNPK